MSLGQLSGGIGLPDTPLVDGKLHKDNLLVGLSRDTLAISVQGLDRPRGTSHLHTIKTSHYVETGKSKTGFLDRKFVLNQGQMR